MVNSKQKGARVERLFRDLLKRSGYDARRGRQYSGDPSAPDVISPGIPGVHWEVKGVEALNIRAAYTQSQEDAGDAIPIVAHKKKAEDWLVTLSAEDFLTFFIPGYLAERRSKTKGDKREVEEEKA